MNNRTIRKCFLTLPLFALGSALYSCFASPNAIKTITVFGNDGVGVEYTVTVGSTFDYQFDDNGSLFVGCFEEKDGEGDKFVMHDGKSVEWEESMPDTLYAYYVSKENLSFSANRISDNNSLSVTNNGSKDIEAVPFDDAYVAYMGESDLKALTTISFDHMDVASAIYDNWSDLVITCNDKEIYKNSLRANIDWIHFSETFELESKDLSKGLTISLGHATGNASNQTSTIKNIKVEVHLYTEEQLSNEISFEELGQHFEQYMPDGSQMLRATTMSAQPGCFIPYQVKKLLEKYNQSDLSVTFTISSYGKKFLLMDNWGDSFCKVLDKDENELQSKFVKLQNNSGYSSNSCTINMTKGQAKLLSKVIVSLEYPTKNASAQPYYTKSIKVDYTFTTNA